MRFSHELSVGVSPASATRTMAVMTRVAEKMIGKTDSEPASGTKSPKYGSSIARNVVRAQYVLPAA